MNMNIAGNYGSKLATQQKDSLIEIQDDYLGSRATYEHPVLQDDKVFFVKSHTKFATKTTK